MNRPSTGTAGAGPWVISVLFTMAVAGLGATAVATAVNSDVAAASPFGRAGTVLVSVISAVIACVGVVTLWRGPAGRYRAGLFALLLIAMGSAIWLAYRFFTSGTTTSVLGYLPGEAAVALGLIGREVVASPPGRRGR